MSTHTDDESLADRLRAKAMWHQREADRYSTAADVVEAEARPVVAPSRPRASHAKSSSTSMALGVINSDDRRWTVPEIMAEMNARGWVTNADNVVNTVRTAAARLAAQGQIERVGNGLYQRRQSPPASSELASPQASDETAPDQGEA